MSLFPFTLTSPGTWGVNLEEKEQPIHPNWATIADSLVLDKSSQLSCRGSIGITTTVASATELLRLFTYINSAGVEIVISTAALKIFKGITDLTAAGNAIESTTAPTAGFWKFANFNGKVVGWQKGHAPIVWSGTSVFTNIAVSDGGTLPDGDVMHAAFGRIWAVDDDRQTVRYSGLLDETQWAVASGAGSIDMRNVWTQGMDYVTAIASLGANLIIFGRKHIFFYTDGQGSVLGVDPDQMYVVDTIEGTGCVSRDSVTSIGEGDLVFLSEIGVQSLRRVVQSKDNPMVTMTWQIADRIASAVGTELNAQADPSTDVRGFVGLYTPSTGQFFLVHNNGAVEDVYVFHMDGRSQDEKGRELVPITIWDTSVLPNMRGATQLRGGNIYFTGGTFHNINRYNPDGTRDNSFSPIVIDYESGWIDWLSPETEHLTKMLKFVQTTVSNPAGLESITTFKYGADFALTLDELAAPASEFDPVRNLYDPMGDVEGQYLKVGLEDDNFGGRSVQQIGLHMKLGRMAFSHNKLGQGVVGSGSGGSGGSGDTVPDSNLQTLIAISLDGAGGSSLQRCQTSQDGITWTIRSMASIAAWCGVGYSPDLHLAVAVGADNINTSPDGITWTLRTSPGAGDWADVCWSPDLEMFVAVGGGGSTGSALTLQRTMTSTDGITWTLGTTPANCDDAWSCVIWSPRLRAFVAGATGGATNQIMTSPDGITWTLRTTPSCGVDVLCESDNLIVGFDKNNNSLIYSADGINWILSAANGFNTAAAYSPSLDLFVTSALAAELKASPAGILTDTWVAITVASTSWEAACWSEILGLFVMLDNAAAGNAVAYSADGITWTAATSAASNNWVRVIETEAV